MTLKFIIHAPKFVLQINQNILKTTFKVVLREYFP